MTRAVERRIGGQNVSRETMERLVALDGLVRRWTPVINLVSKTSLPALWDRHIVDSAQLFPLCPEGASRWVDLGSGGGFPGLVVAILAAEMRPGLRVVLVESDQRKATFLRQAAQTLGVNVTVHAERIEALLPEVADVVSARAVAPLTDLLGFAARHLAADGVAIFPKGGRHSEELAEARRFWNFEADVQPSLSETGAGILVIRKIRRAEQN
jgi:16S rRNA (guanine527-N7)-methyltransferase